VLPAWRQLATLALTFMRRAEAPILPREDIEGTVEECDGSARRGAVVHRAPEHDAIRFSGKVDEVVHAVIEDSASELFGILVECR
jgi:hypothetical protein